MKNKGIMYALIGIFLWGFSPILMKALSTSMPPTEIVFARYLIGGIILMPFIFIEKDKLKTLNVKDYFLMFFFFILLATIISNIIAQIAIIYIDASVLMLLLGLEPLFIVILSTLFLKEKMNGKMALLILLALLGSYLVAFKDLSISTDNAHFIGVMLAIATPFFWAFGPFVGKQLLKKLESTTLIAIRFLLASLILGIFIFLTRGFDKLTSISRDSLILLLLFGVFQTALAYAFFYKGLKSIKASTAGMILLLIPIITIILDFLINKVVFTVTQTIGTLIILVALYYIIKIETKQQAEIEAYV